MADSVILEQKPVHKSAWAKAETSRQRLYIFPTQHGLVFAIMLAVMLVGAVNYTNNMAYMLTFLLGSLYMVCMLHTYSNLRGLIISTNNARPVFAGEIAEFPVIFDNRLGPERTSLNVHRWPKRRKLRKFHQIGIEYTRISSAQMYRDLMPIQTISRGFLSPGRLRIHSSYPLGLFRAWSYINCKSVCVVYPKPEGNPRLPNYSDDANQDQSGELVGTDDFIGFRHYRPGDSIRSIDWKILAREQGLMVKKFSGCGAIQLILHWEQTIHIGDVEKRLSQLALWIIRAEQSGLRYGLEIPNNKIEPGHGEHQQNQCLGALADYGNDNHV